MYVDDLYITTILLYLGRIIIRIEIGNCTLNVLNSQIVLSIASRVYMYIYMYLIAFVSDFFARAKNIYAKKR